MRVAHVLLLLALLFAPLAAHAGVVEDAEAILETMPSDDPSRKVLSPNAALGESSRPSQTRRISTSSQGSSVAPAGKDSLRPRAGGAGVDATRVSPSGQAADVVPEETAAQREARGRHEARDNADNALSFGGLLLLVALVVAGAMFSRRSERAD